MRQITSGKWATRALVVHVLKYFMTTVNIFGADVQARLKKTATGLLRSGTLYSCNTIVNLTEQ